MEVDRVPEPLAIAEAAGHALDSLDLGVDGLGAGVGGFQNDRMDDPFEMCADHASDSCDGLEPRAEGPRNPGSPCLACPAAAGVMSEAHRLLFDGPSARRLAGDTLRALEELLGVARQAAWIGQPFEFGADEGAVSFFHKMALLATSNFVDSVSEVLGHVKLVESDLLLSLVEDSLDDRDIRCPHVHAERLRSATGPPAQVARKSPLNSLSCGCRQRARPGSSPDP